MGQCEATPQEADQQSRGHLIEGESPPTELRDIVGETDREIYEYGNGALAARLLSDVEELLAEFTPYHEELLAMAIFTALDPRPLRRLAFRLLQLALSRDSTTNLSSKHLPTVFTDTGHSEGWWLEFFNLFIEVPDMFLYDLITGISQSTQLSMAEKSYNVQVAYKNQIDVLQAFIQATESPTGVEVYSRSFMDIPTIGNVLERLPSRYSGSSKPMASGWNRYLRSSETRGLVTWQHFGNAWNYLQFGGSGGMSTSPTAIGQFAVAGVISPPARFTSSRTEC